MSDIGQGIGEAIVGGMIVCAIGGIVIASGISYGANKLYFEPTARASEFNTRAQNVLAARQLTLIKMSDFEEGAAGCAVPLHGATFTAENKQADVVRGALCVSRTTEMTLRLR